MGEQDFELVRTKQVISEPRKGNRGSSYWRKPSNYDRAKYDGFKPAVIQLKKAGKNIVAKKLNGRGAMAFIKTRVSSYKECMERVTDNL